MDGDDIGRWLQQQRKPSVWALLLPEQQERLTKLGVQSDQAPPPAPAAARTTKGQSKAQQAFQRGLAALAQWVEREGADRPVPRGHSEEITIDDETEPVVVETGCVGIEHQIETGPADCQSTRRPRRARTRLGSSIAAWERARAERRRHGPVAFRAGCSGWPTSPTASEPLPT